MRVLFRGQVPKELNYPEATEDAVEVLTNSGLIALSDGASESYDSRTWARLIVDAFICSSAFNQKWLADVVRQYNIQFDLSALSWSKQAAFERGSFATLLGVEMLPDHSTVKVFSVGDSFAVLLKGIELKESFPYTDPDQFKQRPELLCTNAHHNTFIESPDFLSQHSINWDLQDIEQPMLLCMTDALGEWALRMAKDGSPQWETLSSITEATQLESIVQSEREQNRMRVDDVTLVVIAFSGEPSDELSHT